MMLPIDHTDPKTGIDVPLMLPDKCIGRNGIWLLHELPFGALIFRQNLPFFQILSQEHGSLVSDVLQNLHVHCMFAQCWHLVTLDVLNKISFNPPCSISSHEEISKLDQDWKECHEDLIKIPEHYRIGGSKCEIGQNLLINKKIFCFKRLRFSQKKTSKKKVFQKISNWKGMPVRKLNYYKTWPNLHHV